MAAGGTKSSKRGYTRCRLCTRSTYAGDYISTRGLCFEHGAQRVAENARQQAEKSGPAYDNWRKSMMKFARSLAS